MENNTGFSNSTFTAVCTIIGVDPAGDNSGLKNKLADLYKDTFKERASFTIGEVVNAFALSLVKI